jgi:hypothetical protein
MATYGTAEATTFCFDVIAKRIVGKMCPSVVSSVTKTYLIPPELASIVSLKFTFAVIYNNVSFHDVEKELLIKSIITAHGRARSLPGPQTLIPALLPSTPNKSVPPGNLMVSPSKAMARLSTSSSLGVSLRIKNSLSPLYMGLHFFSATMFASHMLVSHYIEKHCTEQKNSSNDHIPKKSANQLTIEPTFTSTAYIFNYTVYHDVVSPFLYLEASKLSANTSCC